MFRSTVLGVRDDIRHDARLFVGKVKAVFCLALHTAHITSGFCEMIAMHERFAGYMEFSWLALYE